MKLADDVICDIKGHTSTSVQRKKCNLASCSAAPAHPDSVDNWTKKFEEEVNVIVLQT